MTVSTNQNVSFTYESLSGEVKPVENLRVDRVFTSADGNRIVQGWLEATGEGRAYREDRITELSVV